MSRRKGERTARTIELALPHHVAVLIDADVGAAALDLRRLAAYLGGECGGTRRAPSGAQQVYCFADPEVAQDFRRRVVDVGLAVATPRA